MVIILLYVGLLASFSLNVSLLLRKQGCNSIDIWNFRLELGRKLRQELRTCLGTYFLAVG